MGIILWHHHHSNATHIFFTAHKIPLHYLSDDETLQSQVQGLQENGHFFQLSEVASAVTGFTDSLPYINATNQRLLTEPTQLSTKFA